MIKKLINWITNGKIEAARALAKSAYDDEIKLIEKKHSETESRLNGKISQYDKHLSFCVLLLDGRCPPEHLHSLQSVKDFMRDKK